jgi:hypothetical protein
MSPFPLLRDPMKLVYYALITILLWSYWRALKRSRDKRTPFTPIMGWLVGLGYFVVAPLTILVLHGGYQIPDYYEANVRYASVDLSDARYLIPMIVIWLSLIFAFQSVSLLRPRKESAWSASDLPVQDRKLRRALFLTLGLSILDSVFTVWRSGGLESFLISHWYLRQQESFAKFGDLFVVYAQLSLANQILFIAAAVLFTARQLQLRTSAWRMFSLIGLGLLVQMAMTGNRIFIAFYGLSFLTACWAYQRKKLIAAVLLVSPLILLFFSAWGTFRHDLTSIAADVPGYVEKDMDSRLMTTLMDTTEGANVMQLIHIVNDFGDKFQFFYGSTYAKGITFLVPRVLYPNKPENYPVQIAKLYEPGEVTSFGTTQLGELYANFGVFVVLLLPSFTIMILFLSAKLTPKIESHALLLAVLFLLMISFARASFEDNFITFVFTVVLMWGLRLQRGLYHTVHLAPLRQLAQT